MGWSNQIPPNIITQADGTTVFTGAISVESPDGSTAASIGTDGTVNALKGNFTDLLVPNPNGGPLFDIGTVLANLPQGLVATVEQTSNTVTVNDATVFLVLLTNQFKIDSRRAYMFQSNALRLNMGSPAVGDLWVVKLVLYTAYPTPSNYHSGYTTLDGIVKTVDNTTGWMHFPGLHYESYPGAIPSGSTCYLGLIVSRATGTDTLVINASNGANPDDNGPMCLSVIDLGVPSFTAPGVLNPIGYQGTVAPPPATYHQQGFVATWTMSYDSDSGGNQFYGGTSHMYQGDIDASGGSNHGIELSAANFDYTTIGNDLNGATNVSVYLNFYCRHTWYNSGMNYVIFSHNTRTGSAPGNESGVVARTVQFTGSVAAPGWLSIALPSALWNGFINGTLSGFGFYADSTDLSYYGYFDGLGDPNPPYLAVYWTK